MSSIRPHPVAPPTQKGIVVGKGGAMIKAIGTAARLDLEEYLERRIYLELFVRVETGWREDRAILAQLDRDVDVDLSIGAEGGEGGELDEDLEEDAVPDLD